MKLKKWLGVLLSLVMAFAIGVGIAACGDDVQTSVVFVTVTWYDGETVLSQNKNHAKNTVIKADEKPDTTKEGYTFDNWYTAADFKTQFDFSKTITANTNIYGKWTKNGEEPEQHTHSLGAWSVTQVPTMSETGTATRTCTAQDCDHSAGFEETVELPALTDTNYTVTENTATCTEKGTGTYSITLEAGTFTFTAETAAKGHDFGELIEETPATCTEDGTKAHYHCATCEKDFLDVEGEPAETPATEEELKIQAAGHTYTAEPTWQWTETADGYTATATFTCAVCGKDGTHTEPAQVTMIEQENQCTKDKVYTATVTFNGQQYQETKTVTFEGQHNYGDLIEEVAATCLTEGTKEHYHCDKCEHDFDREFNDITGDTAIPKTEHHMQEHAATEATCTEAGNELYYTCENECDDKIYKDIEGNETWADLKATERPATGHDYAPVAKKDATCTEDGTKAHYHCDKCQKDFLEQDGVEASEEDLTSKAKGHTYTAQPTWDWVGDDANGYTAATATFTCDFSDATQKVTVTKEEGKIVETSTTDQCTTKKVYTATVTFEGKEYTGTKTVTIEGTHNYVEVAEEPATCTKGGVKRHWHCDKCQKDFDYDTKEEVNAQQLATSPLGHTYPAEWTITPPTMDGKGSATKTCTRQDCDKGDDYQLTVELPELTDKRYHVEGDNATCTEAGTGTYSIMIGEETFTFTAETKAKGHTYGELIPATPATCTKEGTKAHYHCTECNKDFLDKDGKEASKEDLKEDALGHKYPAAWTISKPTEELEGKAEKICPQCEEGEEGHVLSVTLPKLGTASAYTITTTQAATCTKDGEDLYSLNDATYKDITFTVTVKAKGHIYGDWTIEAPTMDEEGTATRSCNDPKCNQGEGKDQSVTLPKLSEAEKYQECECTQTADCTHEGKYHCTYASEYGDITFDATIAKTPHAYEWKYNKEQHWQDCKNCDDTTEPQGHSWNEDGLCETCGAHQYTAKFELGSEFKGQGTVAPITVFETETQIQLPTPPDNPNYSFEGWQNGSRTYQANENYDLKANVTFTAKWTKIEAKDNNSYFIIGKGKGILKGSNWTDNNYTVRQIPRASVGKDVDRFELQHVLLYEGDVFKFRSINTIDDDGNYAWLGYNDLTLGGTGGDGVNYGSDYVKEAESDKNFEVKVSGYYTITFYTGDSTHHIDIVKEDGAVPAVKDWDMYLIGSIGEDAEIWMGSPMAQFHMKNEGSLWTITATLTKENVPTTWQDKQEGKVALKVLNDGGYGEDYGVGTEKNQNLWLAPGTWKITFNQTTQTITYKQIFTVTFESGLDGVDAPEKVTKEGAGNITLPTMEGKIPAGYTFKGWKVKDSAGTPTIGQYNVTKDVTLVGVWEEISYTVTFEKGVAQNAQLPQDNPFEITIDDTVDLEAPTAVGYKFLGWDYQGQQYENSFTLTAENLPQDGETITFTAQWEAIKYTITFESQIEGAKLPAAPKDATIGTALPQDATLAGYAFLGWTLHGDGQTYTELNETLITAAKLGADKIGITLTAKWKANEYTVVYADGVEGEEIDVPTDTKVYKLGGDATTITVEEMTGTRKGYKFDKWQLDKDSYTANSTIELSAVLGLAQQQEEAGKYTITLTATWTANKYTVQFAHDPELAEGEKTDVASMPKVEGELTVESGSNTFALTTPTRPGYTFTGWEYSGKSVEGTFTLTQQNVPTGETITVTAKWNKDVYTVKFTSEKDGEGLNLPTEPAKASIGDVITLDPLTLKGYTFEGWYVGADKLTIADGKYTYTLTKDNLPAGELTFKAKWNAIGYTIEFDKNAPAEELEGSIEGDTSNENATLDSPEITLPTLSLTGYTFDGWTTQKGSGKANTGSMSLTADMIPEKGTTITLYASWTEIGKVTASFNAGEGVEAPVSQTVYQGSQITFPEAKRTGYTLTGWQAENSETDPEIHAAKSTYTLNATTTYNAVWAAITYTVKFTGDGVAETQKEFTLDNATAFENPAAREGYTFVDWQYDGKTYTQLTAALIEAAKPQGETPTITLTANWKANEYTVVYAVDAGVTYEGQLPTDEQIYKFGGTTTITVQAMEATRKGYKFDKWMMGGTPVDTTIELINAIKHAKEAEGKYTITLTATWTANKYTVEFKHEPALAEGEKTDIVAMPEVKGELTVEDGSNTFELTKPTRPGYTFTGWDYNGAAVSGTFTLTQQNVPEGDSLTLTAKWSLNNYTLTFKDNEHEQSADDITNVTITSGSHDLPTIDAVGYDFEGWLYNGITYKAFTLTKDRLPKEGTTLEFTAKWNASTYNVTFKSSEEHETDQALPEATTITTEGTISLTALNDDAEWHFLGWEFKEELYTENFKLTLEMLDDNDTGFAVTFTAKWERKIKVTFDVDGNETTAYVVRGETIPEGDYPSDPQKTEEGHTYRFDGWYEKVEDQPYDKKAAVEEDLTLEARFIEQFTVTYYDENNEPIAAKAETIDENTPATKATADKKGYKFSDNVTRNIWKSEWYTNEARTEKYDGGPIKENTNLYRKWIEDTSSSAFGTSITDEYIMIGNSQGGSALNFQTERYDVGLFRKDTTLTSHTIYTVTVALNNTASFRFKIATKPNTWNDSTDIGWSNIQSAWGTTYFGAGKDSNNITLKTSGVFKFIIAKINGTVRIAYEKLYEINTATEEGYYLVGSMTGWGDYGCTPIYLGPTSTQTGKALEKNVEITTNDLGVSGTSRLPYAMAKVAVGHTYKDGFFYISDWGCTTNLEEDTNFHFPNGTGTFRVTFTVSSSSLHQGMLKAELVKVYSYHYSLGEAEGEVTYPLPEDKSENSLTAVQIQLPEEEPEWAGHVFKGWKVNSEVNLYEAGATVTLKEGPNTITAQWKKLVTVTFEAEGLEGGQKQFTIEEGTSVTDWPEVPAKIGYENGKWVSGGETYDANSTFDADITLTASYDAIEYTVTFSSEHGSVAAATVTLDNATINLNEKTYVLTEKGYDFGGWTGDGVEKNTFTLTPDLIKKLVGGNKTFTLTATWTERTYTVEFVHNPELNGEIVEGLTPDQQVTLGDAITLPETLADRTDYKFGSWSINGHTVAKGTTTATVTLDMIADGDDVKTITVTVVWVARGSYSITFIAEAGEDHVEGMPEGTFTVKENGVYEIPDNKPTRKGYKFLGWYIGDDETLYNYGDATHGSYTVKADVTFKAKWEELSYTIVFSDPEHSTTSQKIEGVKRTNGPHTLPQPEKEGYTFTGWKLNESKTFAPGENFTLLAEYVPEGDSLTIILTAQWEIKRFTVTFKKGDYGIFATEKVEGVAWNTEFELNEYTIEDDEEAHMHFRGWKVSGTDDTEIVTSVTVTDNVTLVAVWEAMIEVTFNVNGSVTTVYVVKGELIPNEAYPQNPTKTETGKKFRFDDWYADGSETAYVKSTPVTKELTLTAQFIEQVTVTFEYMYLSGTSISNRNAVKKTAATITIDKGTAYSDAKAQHDGTWPSAPAASTGVAFDAWYFEGTKYTQSTKINSNLTLIGKFKSSSSTTTYDKMYYTLVGDGSATYDSLHLNDWREGKGAPATGDNLLFSKRDDIANNGFTIWTIEVALTAQKEFKVMLTATQGSWAWGTYGNLELNDKNLIAGTGANKGLIISAGGTNGNGNNIKATQTGIYRITLYTNPSTTTSSLAKDSLSMITYELLEKVSSFTSSEHNVYVRGSFNNWLNEDGYSWADYKMTRSDTTYTFDLTVTETVQFKVFDLYTREWFGDGTAANNNIEITEGAYRLTYNSSEKKLTYVKIEDYDYTYSFGKHGETSYGGTSQLPAGGTVHSTSPTIKLADAPVWEGYIFKGWQVGGKTYGAGTSVAIPGKNTTITAIWAKEITITFDFGDRQETVTIEEKTAVGTEAWKEVPDKVGYKDGKWMNGESEATEKTTFSENTKLTLEYTPIEYTLTFTDDKLHTSTDPDSMTLQDATKQLPDLKKAGYTFLGWTYGDVVEPTKEFKLTEALIQGLEGGEEFIFNAKWEAISYTLTFDITQEKLDGMGAVTAPVDPPQSVSLDDPEITLPVLSMEGFIFKGWRYKDETDRNGTFTLTEELLPAQGTEITFTMHWEVKPAEETFYSYTYNLGYEAEGAPAGGKASSNDDYKITLSEDRPERAGYNFLGWKVGESTYQPGATVQIPNDNYVIEAKWETIEYTATFSIGAHAADTVNEADYPAWTVTIEDDGFAVTLPDAPAAVRGYKFLNWSWEEGGEPQTGNPQETIHLTESVTITAEYEALTEITVTWYVDGQVHGSAETYYEGETLNVPQITAKYGFTFDGWYQSSTCSGSKYTTSSPLGSGTTTLKLYGRQNLISDTRTYYITGFGGGTVNASNNKTFTAGQLTKGSSTTANTFTLTKVLLIYGDTIDIRYGTSGSAGTLAVAANALYSGNTSVFNSSSSASERATVKASGYYNITLTTLCKDSTTTSERQYTIKFTKTSDTKLDGYWIVGSMTSNGTWGSTQSPIFVNTSISTTYTRIVKVTTSSQYGNSDCGSGCHAGEVKVVKATYTFSTNTLGSVDWTVYYQEGNYWCADWSQTQNKHINTIGTFTLTIKTSGSKAAITSHTYSSSTT